jgi:DNA (cytosine-5)-methyltransferase 1
LFFDFIDLAKKLQPKVVVAENVKGLLMGDAKQYVIKIYKEFDAAGYYCQHFLLNASCMGVPQKRERVFFVALRKDLATPFLYQQDFFITVPLIDLSFNEAPVLFRDCFHDYTDRPLKGQYKEFWDNRQHGDIDFSQSSGRMRGKPNSQFQYKYLYMDDVSNTITSSDLCVLFDHPRYRNFDEVCECGSYPKDYNFMKCKPEYVIGMSVPPVMTAQVATRIWEQWLSHPPHDRQKDASQSTPAPNVGKKTNETKT